MLSSLLVKAQQELAFPFQGGKQVMMDYFAKAVVINPEMAKRAANGSAVFKFTADEKGTIKKIIVYYADDIMLTQPLIDALKQSDHKWIIPDREKLHDFIIPFAINFNMPAKSTPGVQKALYNYYESRKPVITYNQVPLDMATLLPTITVTYDISGD